MGAMGIILILIVIGAGIYLYQNPEILQKSTIQNPLDQFLVRNETPSSTITNTNSIVGYGKPWQYYSCSVDTDCQKVFLVGTFCNQTTGECYSKK